MSALVGIAKATAKTAQEGIVAVGQGAKAAGDTAEGVGMTVKGVGEGVGKLGSATGEAGSKILDATGSIIDVAATPLTLAKQVLGSSLKDSAARKATNTLEKQLKLDDELGNTEEIIGKVNDLQKELSLLNFDDSSINAVLIRIKGDTDIYLDNIKKSPLDKKNKQTIRIIGLIIECLGKIHPKMSTSNNEKIIEALKSLHEKTKGWFTKTNWDVDNITKICGEIETALRPPAQDEAAGGGIKYRSNPRRRKTRRKTRKTRKTRK